MRTTFVLGFKHFGRDIVVSQSLLKFGWIPKPLLLIQEENKDSYLRLVLHKRIHELSHQSETEV